MFCIECGKEIPNGVKFCPDCGASQIAKVEENPVKAKPKKEVLPKKIDYSKMSIAEVKEIVKSKNLPVSGPKWRLIERLTNKNWKENEMKERKSAKLWVAAKTPKVNIDNLSAFLLYALSFLIPLVGFIIGAIYITKNGADYKDVGQTCLFLALTNIILILLMISGEFS